MNPNELREKRAKAWADAQEYLVRQESGERLSQAEQASWRRAVDEVDRLGEQIRGTGTPEPKGSIDTRGGYVDGSAEMVGFRGWLRTGEEHHIRAAGVGTGTAGGYMVPAGFAVKITETMKAFGGLRRLAEVIPTDNGRDLPWPTNDDTSNVGAILGENTQASEQDFELGQKQLGGYAYTSKLVRVSLQLAQDAAFQIDPWLARRLGIRIGRAQAAHWLTGTGASQPQGILTGGTVGKTAASATAITYDELVDLQTSVDSAYLEEANAGVEDSGVAWVMHQNTFGYIRKLKDSQNRPLIEPNLQTGRPTSLLGYEVVIDNGMPSTLATTNKTIAFGNFRAGYVIRDVGGPEVIRMVERFADYLQLGFIGWHRSDGAVQDASAFKILQQA